MENNAGFLLHPRWFVSPISEPSTDRAWLFGIGLRLDGGSETNPNLQGMRMLLLLLGSAHFLPFLPPVGSMYGIFTYIYHKCKPNVGKYSIHGSYGSWKWKTSLNER